MFQTKRFEEMEYKNSVEAVYIQLNEILQNVAGWGAEKELREIDIDLTLGKIRDIYDLVLSLRNEQQNLVAEEKVKESPSPQKPIETKEEIPQNNIDEETIEFEAEKPIEDKKSDDLQSIKEKIKTSIQRSQQQNSQNLSEQYEKSQPTLNEELSTHVESKDLAIKLKTRPITNLSSAIGLNEKFEFIQSLFNGDKEKYEETIETLNSATNFNGAYNYLSTKLNWDMSDPLAQRILELIRRKLIVNSNE